MLLRSRYVDRLDVRVRERAAQDGIRTSRAEGTITLGDRRFPIGLNTTAPDKQDGAESATATAMSEAR